MLHVLLMTAHLAVGCRGEPPRPDEQWIAAQSNIVVGFDTARYNEVYDAHTNTALFNRGPQAAQVSGLCRHIF